MLELKDISLVFNKNSNSSIEALNDINISFNEREWTYIIGGNGSGKSTLLKVINKELMPDSGEVLYNDCSMDDILLIDQVTSKNLVVTMTVYENLIFGLKKEGMLLNLNFYQQKRYRQRVLEILTCFNLGLENRLNEQVRFLSGGEQQILVAARIMLSNPKILLMDEFTSALDQKWAPFILHKLKTYVVENKIMVIAITHDYNQINNTGDRLLMLKNGKIIADKKNNDFDFSTLSILNLFNERL